MFNNTNKGQRAQPVAAAAVGATPAKGKTKVPINSRLTRDLVPMLGAASVVNILSGAGLHGSPVGAAYPTSKNAADRLGLLARSLPPPPPA